MILYGIPNCGTVKKARMWLSAHDFAYDFHDFKKVSVDEATLRGWVDRLGWEVLLNRAGTTFRKLPDVAKQDLDAARAIELMVAYPSAIKRPVLVEGETLLVGFRPETWAAALA